MFWILTKIAALVCAQKPETLERWSKFLGLVFFRILKIRQNLIMENLTIAFPDKSFVEKSALGEASMAHFFMTVFEFLRAPTYDPVKDVKIVGLSHLNSALEKKQGVYLLCCHMGNWEVMGATMTRLVTPSYVLVKKVGFKGLNQYVAHVREMIGFLTVKREKKGDGLRRIEEILGRGEIVGFVMDQARPGEPKLPFFGKPAKTNTSFAAIHKRFPAPIIPGYIVRDAFGQHTLTFEPELILPSTGDDKNDILVRSTFFNETVARIVCKAPQCYFWLHNRWK